MHGTYINEEQIPIDEEVEVKSGDVLTFGNEVTRWPSKSCNPPSFVCVRWIVAYSHIRRRSSTRSL